MFKKSHSHSILGIDITSTAIKILELSTREGKPIVENYRQEILPSNAMDGAVIKNSGAVSKCLKNAVDKLHTSCKQAIMAVPDAAVISKVIQINEGFDGDEVEELIITEADKYIPYPIDEINFDFEILGSSQKKSNLLDVLIVATRTENVNQLVEIATSAGLDIVSVDVESYAVERAMQHLVKNIPQFGQDKIIAIIDIGASDIHMFVFHDMKLIYSRAEKFGALPLIELSIERHNVASKKAGATRKMKNVLTNFEREIFESFKESILLHIKRALQFFNSINPEGDVDSVLLAGCGASLPGLVPFVAEELGVKATIINPIAWLPLGQKIYLNSINDTPALLVACGLALYKVSL